jgi:hypothetical protein
MTPTKESLRFWKNERRGFSGGKRKTFVANMPGDAADARPDGSVAST